MEEEKILIDRIKKIDAFIKGEACYNGAAETLDYIESMKKDQKRLKEEVVASRLASLNRAIVERSINKRGKQVMCFDCYVDSRTRFRCSTKEALIEKLYDFFFEKSQKEYTLEDVYKLLCDYKRAINAREKTLKRNSYDWNVIKQNEIARMKMPDITLKVVKRYFLSLAPTVTKKKFNNIRSLMNSIFQFAIEELEIINTNYSRMLVCSSRNGYNFIPAQSHQHEVYTRKEREQILQYLENLPKQSCYTRAIRLMFCFDCRVGEIKALKWSDYHENKNEIPMMSFHSQVVTDIDRNGKYYNHDLGITKAKDTRGNRLLPVTPRARKVLDEIRAEGIKSEYILASQANLPISQTQRVNEVLKNTCLALGIDYHSSHRLRNYSISEQAREGLDINTIAYNSGHLDKKMTLDYLRRNNENDCEEIYTEWMKIHN